MNIEQQKAIEGKVIKDKRNAMPADTMIASPKYLGNESLSNLPLEVKKPCSLLNLTSWANLVIRGTISNVEQMETVNQPLYPLTNCDTAISIVIPSQNVIFQKLSLFSRAFIQFIVIYALIYQVIVTALNSSLKQIRNRGLLIILLFSSTVANAEILKELINGFEQQYNIPQGLLYSIAQVESQANPYAINVKGKAIISNSKAAALKAIEHYRAQSYTNIDIGVCRSTTAGMAKSLQALKQCLIFPTTSIIQLSS